MKQLQKTVFKALIDKPSRFTGDEVRFIRKYLKMTQINFSAWLNMSNHSVVSQWENRENELSGMDYNTELLLRLQMAGTEKKIFQMAKLQGWKNLSKSNKNLEILAQNTPYHSNYLY
jgi:DNA-binding transcriptional regulator YiaG